VLSALRGAGDGDPDSEVTRATVELFDAIMGTWRWTRADDAWAESADR
jgi:hypothetical protein